MIRLPIGGSLQVVEALLASHVRISPPCCSRAGSDDDDDDDALLGSGGSLMRKKNYWARVPIGCVRARL